MEARVSSWVWTLSKYSSNAFESCAIEKTLGIGCLVVFAGVHRALKSATVGIRSNYIFAANVQYIPRESLNSCCTDSREENFAYVGFGKIQSIRCAKPISELPDCSIIDLATAG